jgi:hypothetical protein
MICFGLSRLGLTEPVLGKFNLRESTQYPRVKAAVNIILSLLLVYTAIELAGII